MPLNTLLLFACGILLGLLLRKRGAPQQLAVPVTRANAVASPFGRQPQPAPMGFISRTNDAEEFGPQLANLQMAISNIRQPGMAYSAARSAGILR